MEGQAFRPFNLYFNREGEMGVLLIEEETEAPKGGIMCPRLCSWEVADLDSKRVLADGVRQLGLG